MSSCRIEADRLCLLGSAGLAALAVTTVAGCGPCTPAFERPADAATVAVRFPAASPVGGSLLAAGPEEAPEEIVEFYDHVGDEHERELRPRRRPRFPGEPAAHAELSESEPPRPEGQPLLVQNR